MMYANDLTLTERINHETDCHDQISKTQDFDQVVDVTSHTSFYKTHSTLDDMQYTVYKNNVMNTLLSNLI